MGFLSKLKNTLLPGEAARLRAEEEARFHLEMRSADLEADGFSPDEARLQARRDFGNVLAMQEATGDRDVFLFLESFAKDFRVAWRRLRHSPVFFSTALLLLAFGIGVNTAVFSIVDHLFLRPLPLPDSERIVVLEEYRKGVRANSNPLRIRDWAERVPAFSAVMGHYGEAIPLQTADGKRAVQTLRTVGDFLSVLGVQPLRGRDFTPREKLGENVALLTERGRSLAGLGDSLNLGGDSYLVIGIVPDLVSLGEDVQIITPAPRSVQAAPRIAGFLPVIARLHPGQNAALAARQAEQVARQLAKEYPATDAGLFTRLISAQQAWTAEAQQTTWLLQAACLLLLGITILNVSALFASRTVDRQKESAIRSFLGATRFSILRLHFAEAFLLTILGCATALLVASWSLSLLKDAFGASFAPVRLVELDARVFASLAALGLASSLFFVLIMAWQSAHSRRTQSASRPWLRSGLIVVEASLGILLLSVAFRFSADFAELASRPLGFTTQNIIVASIDMPWSADAEEIVTAIDRGQELFAALPGVSSVGVVDRLPLNGGTQSGSVLIQGAAEQSKEEVGFRMASPGFFETLHIPLLSGSPLGEKDAVVVNDVFARRFLPANPIGTYLAREGKNPKWWRVVGVVSSVRAEMSEARPRPEVWLPYRQFSWPKLEFVLASAQAPSALSPTLRKLTSQLNANALLDEVTTLRSRLDRLESAPRQKRDAVLLFGVVALVLVVAGVYGVISTELQRRTREMGIRLAVGASPWTVAALLLRRSAALAACTAAVSLPLALLALRDYLSPGFSLLAALFVTLAMLLAAVLPAWRCSRIQPHLALRTE